MSMFAACWVGTEKLHRTLLGAQLAQHIGHQFVFHMTVCINNEAVIAKTAALCWS